MTKLRSIVCFSFLAILAFGVNAQAGGDAVAFAAGDATTSQAAVYAAFLARVPNDDGSLSADTAISLSNILAAPAGTLGDYYDALKDRSGTVEFFLWDSDGTSMFYETAADSPGVGLDAMGYLQPGRTYTVRLAEILSKIKGLPEDEVEFTGYGWVVGNFDAIAGTYSVTIFGLGFTQNFEFTPAVGHGGTLTGLQIQATSP